MGTIVNFLYLSIVISLASPSGYKPGDTASDFHLKSVDGKFYSMANFKDAKGFIIVFTCNQCPFAVKYEDRINDLAKRYKSKGYILMAINPNDPQLQPADNYEGMVKRAKDKKFVFPYMVDEGQKIFPQYGATKTPHVFLLDKNKTVKYVGAIDDNAEDASQAKEKYLENAIAALEGGTEPNPSVTKAIGCSIKFKKN
jgi:peroxiredoxin